MWPDKSMRTTLENILAFVKIKWAVSLRPMAIRLGGVSANLLHGFERFNVQSKL
jgi:hypothetical protein